MAAAFLLLGIAAFAAMAGSWALAGRGLRDGWRLGAVPALLPLVLSVLLIGYLVTKVAYEEIYPCWFVDEFYCDFSSTQYHDLFGWEF